MPKRKSSDNREEKWRKKIRKYEEKLKSKRRNYSGFSSEDDREVRDKLPSPWSPVSQTRSLASIVREPRVADSQEVEVCNVVPPSLTPVMTAPESGVMADVATAEAAPESMEVNETLTADPELLLALGDFETESNEWGPGISADLAKRWEPILKDGLKKELKEELLKTCLFPENCPLMKPPILNPEISAMLNVPARNRDNRILKKQNQLACALTTLGKTMSDILSNSIDTPAILRNLSNATKLLADSHYSETETRRSLVIPMLDKTFIEPFKNRKRDSHLFGEKLSDFIKSSRGIQKTGKLIQSTVSSANLNFKPPPQRAQSNYRNARPPNRGGGPRVPAPTYRRRATVYPPPAARGHRAPTPPPSTSQRHKQSRTAKQKQ